MPKFVVGIRGDDGRLHESTLEAENVERVLAKVNDASKVEVVMPTSTFLTHKMGGAAMGVLIATDPDTAKGLIERLANLDLTKPTVIR